MVRINRVYTKTGDGGETALGNGQRVAKTDSRIEAYATVDEANSCIGVIIALGEDVVLPEILEVLVNIQNDMFDVGADLCTPASEAPKAKELRVTEKHVKYIETYIDIFNTPLDPLKSFVLPSGTVAASHLHVARTVTRRAERAVWAAIEEHGESVNTLPAIYLNRLSDLLFVLARFCNRSIGDKIWLPGKHVS